MILINKTDRNMTYRIDRNKWCRVLRLARLISWNPMGTCPPDKWPQDKPWESIDYITNVGQTVTLSDSINLSIGIETLSSVIKESNPAKDDDVYWAKVRWDPERHKRWEYAFSIGLKDQENYFLFSDWWGVKLKELVIFCRKGAFKIC